MGAFRVLPAALYCVSSVGFGRWIGLLVCGNAVGQCAHVCVPCLPVCECQTATGHGLPGGKIAPIVKKGSICTISVDSSLVWQLPSDNGRFTTSSRNSSSATATRLHLKKSAMGLG